MREEPKIKRAGVFIDGQNLYYAAKEAYGYTYPNYDPELLAHAICRGKGWIVRSIHFYTGVPDIRDNPYWHSFWAKKLAVMGSRGIKVFSRSLRYHNIEYRCPNGDIVSLRVGNEKGVDVRLAIDAVRMARMGDYNVCLIFSQDQDLSEVAREIQQISEDQDRWIKIASAYPLSSQSKNVKGIKYTDWIKVDRTLYDSCIDPNDYRPKSTLPI